MILLRLEQQRTMKFAATALVFQLSSFTLVTMLDLAAAEMDLRWPGLFPEMKTSSPEITMTLAEKLLRCDAYEESGRFLKHASPIPAGSCTSKIQQLRHSETMLGPRTSNACTANCSNAAANQSYMNCGTSWYKPFVNPPLLNRIIGGIDARPHSLPWSVSVQGHRQHLCGGTLIQFDPNVMMTDLVLTAAHCVLEDNDVLRPFHELNVQIGAHRLSMYETGQQNVRVKRMIAHKSYNFSNPQSDIALIQLEYPVQFSKTVQPICLPPEAETPEPGEVCLVAGWGYLKADTHFNDHLMQVYVPFLDINECAKNDSYGQKIYKEIMLCAGYMDGGRDACQGDSGGPLVCKDGDNWVQRGVVSFGEGCGDKMKPGIYTHVSAFRPWIEQAMAELEKTRSFAQ
uniref:Peptidase S1 domain-containing protein n=1 Tax=Trichuris muris TaxID=70415 RepID=A0A5S6Q672_TRIMR